MPQINTIVYIMILIVRHISISVASIIFKFEFNTKLLKFIVFKYNCDDIQHRMSNMPDLVDNIVIENICERGEWYYLLNFFV